MLAAAGRVALRTHQGVTCRIDAASPVRERVAEVCLASLPARWEVRLVLDDE